MKEFEKLWENNYPIYDMGSDTVGHYNIAEEYWRAALEWVQNARFRSTDEPLNIDKPLYDMLEEELGIS